MIIHRNKYSQIDDLLNRIGKKLQLSDEMYDTVSEKYDEVYNTLNKSGVFDYEGVVYPQGSYALQTTVKPLGKEEFDLDVVIQFNKIWDNQLNSGDVISAVEKSLKTFYKEVEPKNRCVRVGFDGFHLDVVPAFPCDKLDLHKIKVPNSKTDTWKDSYPKGYITWFDNQCKIILLEKCEHYDLHQEDLPEQVPYEKKSPLKIAVQLAKRFRDVYFDSIKAKGTPSIVITTLFADCYSGETTEYEAINNILVKIINRIDNTDGIMEIRNPVNDSEIISECWENKPSNYDNFCNFIKEFKYKWKLLGDCNGMSVIREILESMFEENIASEVILEQAEFIVKKRENDSLYITGEGIISTMNNA